MTRQASSKFVQFRNLAMMAGLLLSGCSEIRSVAPPPNSPSDNARPADVDAAGTEAIGEDSQAISQP